MYAILILDGITHKEGLEGKNMKKQIVRLDSRNRVCLTKVKKNLSELYYVYMVDDKIVLDPIREIPKNEQWLFRPENKEILEKVKEGLKQKGTIDRGSFSEYLDD